VSVWRVPDYSGPLTTTSWGMSSSPPGKKKVGRWTAVGKASVRTQVIEGILELIDEFYQVCVHGRRIPNRDRVVVGRVCMWGFREAA
jgi:hypothetical protein